MDDFTDMFIRQLKKNLETFVYLARAQGLRAGVRPYNAPPEPGDEELPPTKRAVFIEFPEKTIEWPLAEVQAEFLDSLPQYSQ